MRSYSHLSEDERDQIGVLRAGGRDAIVVAHALALRQAEKNGQHQGERLRVEPERGFVEGPADRAADDE